MNPIDLLDRHTHGTFRIWTLAGPRYSGVRAELMAALKGEKVPKAKAGINALRSEFYAIAGVPTNVCESKKEHAFIEYCMNH